MVDPVRRRWLASSRIVRSLRKAPDRFAAEHLINVIVKQDGEAPDIVTLFGRALNELRYGSVRNTFAPDGFGRHLARVAPKNAFCIPVEGIGHG